MSPLVIPLVLLSGCVSLDTFVHNPVHCSSVGPETCEDKDSDWDRVCTPCEEDYAWDVEYPWMPRTLEDGQTVRPIDAATVTNALLPTEDGEGELDVYFVPAHGENPAYADVTVLYSHGNYANLDHYMPRVRYLHEAGFSVLYWDYRGYGKSQPASAPGAEQWLADARQVRDYADTVVPDADAVVIYANSVGGIPAVEQALHSPGCALVLEAPFTGLESITRDNAGVSLPGSFLSMGLFENTEKIKGYEGPLLSMIGTIDVKFTVEEVTLVHDNAGGSADQKQLWVPEGVGHGIADEGIPEAGLTAYFEELETFFAGPGATCIGGVE